MFSRSLDRVAAVAVLLVGCRGGRAADAPPTVHARRPVNLGTPPTSDPVEPVWRPDQVAARVKSPNQHMHFTAGLPFRVLADGNDPRAYQCPPVHPPYVCADSAMAFRVDGAAVGT